MLLLEAYFCCYYVLMWLELLQRENTLIDTLPVISFAIDRLILAL